jgi:hypothetical protein
MSNAVEEETGSDGSDGWSEDGSETGSEVSGGRDLSEWWAGTCTVCDSENGSLGNCIACATVVGVCCSLGEEGCLCCNEELELAARLEEEASDGESNNNNTR